MVELHPALATTMGASPMVTAKLAFSLIALLALAACSHTMSSCSGPVYPLNQGKWTPTEQDLSVRS